MAGRVISADGVTGIEIHTDGTMMYTRPVMSTNIRGAILERNKRLRIEQPLKKLDWIRQEFSFPDIDYWHIRKKYPDLFEGSIEDRKRAASKFLRSPESEPYRVQA